MSTIPDVGDVDLLDREHYRGGVDHELFAEMRRRGPVLWHPKVFVPAFKEEVEFWAVVAHDEVQRANADWETFSAYEGPGIVPMPPERRGMMLVSKDPPDHARMRTLISRGFTPRIIRTIEDKVRLRTGSILDEAEARQDVDFVSEIAYQLPMHVIGDIIGIPEEERAEVFRITDLMLRSMDPQQGISTDDGLAANVELYTYAHALSEAKRTAPTDDVWSILANGELGELELDLFFLILTIAGSETTRNALSQGLMALLNHPEQLADLRADPSLITTATEEVLRWSSPVTCFGRTVTRDVELGGQQLSAGDRIGLFYPSANRDEQVFADADRFDVRRSPNPHVAFGGGGPHFCLGASLARTEIQVLLSDLLARFSSIELTGEPEWMCGGPAINVGTAVQRLPVRLRA